MRKIIIIILLVLPFLASSQQRWKRMRYEVSYGIGVSNFLGELGGANAIGRPYLRDLEVSMTRPALSLGLRYKLTDFTAIKSTLIYGRLRGEDRLTEEQFRNNRNLMFRSPVFEFATQFEFSLRRETIGSRYKIRRIRGRGKKSNDLFFYGFGGGSVFYFNPKGRYQGKWYALRPLNTEGQTLVPTRKQYSRFQFAIPLGFGAKYAVNSTMSIGLEYGVRKTFTDYIDDVSTTYVNPVFLQAKRGTVAKNLADPSKAMMPPGLSGCQTCGGQQRGDPTDNDSYMFMILSLNYKIKTTRKGLPKF